MKQPISFQTTFGKVSVNSFSNRRNDKQPCRKHSDGIKKSERATSAFLCALLVLALFLLTDWQAVRADTIIENVTTGSNPFAIALNSETNKIYVVNYNSNNVTVIDGANNSTTTVASGTNPRSVAINHETNKIYVGNFGSNDVTVIDGANNTSATVVVGTSPASVAVNQATNKVYVANSGSRNVTVISETPANKFVRFDFDGDRKADIAVYRPGNGAW